MPIDTLASGRPPEPAQDCTKGLPLEVLQSAENRRSNLICGVVPEGVGSEIGRASNISRSPTLQCSDGNQSTRFRADDEGATPPLFNEWLGLLSPTEISASYSMRSQIEACRRFCLARLTLLLYLPKTVESLNSAPNSCCTFSHPLSIPHVGASDSHYAAL